MNLPHAFYLMLMYTMTEIKIQHSSFPSLFTLQNYLAYTKLLLKRIFCERPVNRRPLYCQSI